MKKTLLFLLSIFLCGALFSQDKPVSDIAIYKEISQSFENEYYPGTIEKTDLLLELYPDSVFTQSALFYKARALINLSYYEEAVSTLQNAIVFMHTGKDGYAQCHYLLGIAYFYLNDFENAVTSFYVACKVATLNDENDIYNYSIYYSAECYYNLMQFENAVPLYEYVIENGKEFNKNDYINSVKNLMISYNYSNNYIKASELYNIFSSNDVTFDFFEDDTKLLLKIVAAEAYKNLENYNMAYNLYADVIQSGNESYAVIALKEAYILSDSGKTSISLGELFSKTADTFENNPNVVNEFWIRLGIEEYNNGNYKKAVNYFNNVTVENDIIKIYKAKMILDTDSTDIGANKAESILKTLNINEYTSDSYYSLLLQCRVQQNKWDDIPFLYEKIKNPDSKTVYIMSSFYYRNGEYSKVSPETGVLYGSALAKSGNFEKAVNVYEKLYGSNQLNSEDLIDYGKLLFLTGNFEKAYEITLKSSNNDKEYVAGLCMINTGNLEAAKNHFISYIKKMSNSDDFIKIALYYKGYVEYSLGDYKNAYNSFMRFNREADDKYFYYIRNSHYYSAVAALQNNDYERAAFEAENVVKMSLNENDKKAAVIFNFEILRDAGRYDEAVKLMMPYAKEKSDFSAEALYKIADVYSKQGNPELADYTFESVYKKYPGSNYAEESMYRRGEVYYFAGDYKSAYDRFNEYSYKYISGQFLDAALYFSGDCALKLGEIKTSIMINKDLKNKFPDSIYSYGASKNLLSAYYAVEDYINALETAKLLVKNFPDQAAADNIGTKIIELEKITGGTDRRIVEKLSEYNKAGGSSTKNGRIIGSQLVKLYAEKTENHEAGFELAVELLNKQIDEDEITYAADNADFAGFYCSSRNENRKAADYYLLAAQYYRSVNKHDKSAAALYSAAEEFSSAGLIGDAKETADLLKELYPDTNYAQRVNKIVR